MGARSDTAILWSVFVLVPIRARLSGPATALAAPKPVLNAGNGDVVGQGRHIHRSLVTATAIDVYPVNPERKHVGEIDRWAGEAGHGQ
jgi:hypothetical protein